LYMAAESQAFAKDLEKVNELIDQLTQLTKTAGKAIPSRLRLARANAMVSGEGKRTRTNREGALEIVRSVVQSESGNIRARNMLGNLLAMTPESGLPDEEQYVPDLQGAIDQYVILSRRLNNRRAQVYLLEASDLAFKLNDQNQMRSLLREFTTRFASDWQALPFAAERFENVGDLGEAASIYQDVLNNTGNPDAALSLADLQLKQNRLDQGISLLRSVSEAEILSQDQLLFLASLMARSGNEPEAQVIAENGERYGLSAGDARILFARYAQLYLSSEVQVQALREAVVAEPSLVTGWKLLIQRLIELGRLEEAQASYSEALNEIEIDDELTRLGILARGAPENALELLKMPGIEDSPRLRQAVQMVDSYETVADSVSLQQRVQMLSELIDQFPRIDAVQTYAVRELSSLPLNPIIIATYADRALKNAPSDPLIMGIAGEAFLLAGEPQEAVRVVELWQANSLESTIVASAISARAMIQLEQYSEAETLLSPHLDEALQSPDRGVSREVIDAFCFARLKLGEHPTQTAERLRPLIASHRDIRSQVWLGLASGVINEQKIGADWIGEAEKLSDTDDRLALGTAWVNLALNHQAWDREYAEQAIAYFEPLVLIEQQDARVLMGLARAHIIKARSTQDPGLSSDDYSMAVSYMMRASEEDQGNLVPLLDAARFAIEGGMHEQAKTIYEQVIGYDLPDGPLKAMVLNNLAMTSLRVGLNGAEADLVLGYVRNSTALSSDVPPYWGTRGWVELELGEFDLAAQSFRTCTLLDRSSAEGWVGLAIVLSQLGEDQVDELNAAAVRVREMRTQSGLDQELLQMIQKYDLESLLGELVP